MNPNSIWETLSRRLSRFGHHSPLRRALERVGLVKRRPPLPWIDAMAKSPRHQGELAALFALERERHDFYAAQMQRTVNDAWQAAWDAYLEHERSKQIPAVWQAADKARREVE